MSIKPLLFAGVKTDGSKKNDISFVDDLSQVLNRGKGIQTIFDVAINLFSWGRLVPFDDSIRSYFSQGRCIAELCKSAYQVYRAPHLFIQAIRLWGRGKGVKRSTVNLKNHVKSNQWRSVELSKVLHLAKELFGWTASTVSWACRTLSMVNEAFICAIPKQFMQTVGKVGSVASIASFGVMTANVFENLVGRATLPETDNRVLQKARVITREAQSCAAISASSKLLSSLSYGLRTFSLLLVPPVFSLALSTIALGFNIRSDYLKNKCQLDSTRVRIPV